MRTARQVIPVAGRPELPVPCRDGDCGHRVCEAHREGYAEGFEDGVAAGYAARLADGQSAGCSCGG